MTIDTTQPPAPAQRLPTGLLPGSSETVRNASAGWSSVAYDRKRNATKRGSQPRSRRVAVTTLDEVDLIKMAQSGDGDAFVELLSRCGGPGLALINKKIFSKTDRKDVLQSWREIAWRSIGKFDTGKYDRYGPYLTGAAVLAIHQFLGNLGKVAAANQVLTAAIANQAIAFLPVPQPIQPAVAQIVSAHGVAILIKGVLAAKLPPHYLMGFLLVKVLDENPAAAVGDSDQTAVRKIVDAYWNVPFGSLKTIFLNAYAADSGIPISEVCKLFGGLDTTIANVSDKSFADYSGKTETKEQRVDLSNWVYNARRDLRIYLA